MASEKASWNGQWAWDDKNDDTWEDWKWNEKKYDDKRWDDRWEHKKWGDNTWKRSKAMDWRWKEELEKKLDSQAAQAAAAQQRLEAQQRAHAIETHQQLEAQHRAAMQQVQCSKPSSKHINKHSSKLQKLQKLH